MVEGTLFDLPFDPDEINVALEPAALRSLDFSALDFEMIRRAGVEYIRTYFPNDFNDFFASNGVIMFLELISYIGNICSERADILVDESFLPTASSRESVSQHLELIGQEIRGATPAVIDVVATIGAPSPTEIRIPAGLVFSGVGPDGNPLTFEIFRSPEDFTSVVSIPPGKKGVVAFGIEGRFGDPVIATSPGGPDQTVEITGQDVLDEPITVTLTTGLDSEEWDRVPFIEKSGPNDKVYEVDHLDNSSRIRFGDDRTGRAPLAGQIITITYRRGGGIRGRVGANFINETRPINPEPPASAAIEVRFRNLTPSSGGTDEETIEEAKRRAPREFATHDSVVTGEDYAFLAETFVHPVFGAVSKASGVLRSGIEADISQVVADIQNATSVEEGAQILLDNYVNRNIVELYILAEGLTGPVTPSTGLKQGLITFFDEINVLTDEVRILDGLTKSIDIEATIIMSRNADAGTVKEAVIDAINDFFNIRNFDMGESFNVSNLYETIQAIAGVQSTNIFQPPDNILATNEAGPSTDATAIGFNELIVLGNTDLKFFFEKGAFRK